MERSSDSLLNLQNNLPLFSDYDRHAIATLGAEFEIDFINLAYTRTRCERAATAALHSHHACAPACLGCFGSEAGAQDDAPFMLPANPPPSQDLRQARAHVERRLCLHQHACPPHAPARCCREDVREARSFLDSLGMTNCRILAKLETRQSLLNFRGILACADGIVISRRALLHALLHRHPQATTSPKHRTMHAGLCRMGTGSGAQACPAALAALQRVCCARSRAGATSGWTSRPRRWRWCRSS